MATDTNNRESEFEHELEQELEIGAQDIEIPQKQSPERIDVTEEMKELELPGEREELEKLVRTEDEKIEKIPESEKPDATEQASDIQKAYENRMEEPMREYVEKVAISKPETVSGIAQEGAEIVKKSLSGEYDARTRVTKIKEWLMKNPKFKESEFSAQSEALNISRDFNKMRETHSQPLKKVA